MTKTKNTAIPQSSTILTTPLSVTDCLRRFENLANFDLSVNVKRASVHSAEVQFIERHNDDLPLYVTSRLMATQHGTQVSFELSEYLRDDMRQRSPNTRVLTPKQMHLITGMIISLIAMVMMGYRNPEEIWSGVLCFVPFIVILFGFAWMAVSPVDELAIGIKQSSPKIKAIMFQRAEVLKEDIIDVLTVNPEKAHYDELGNAYYLDVEHKQKGGAI